MPTPIPIPLDDPRLGGVESPDFVAGMLQLHARPGSDPRTKSFDDASDPRWLAGHQVLVPYETLPNGQVLPATALYWLPVFSDTEALRAWMEVPPGMTPPGPLLGPVVTHAAIVEAPSGLQALVSSTPTRTIDRVLVNPMGPATTDVKLDLLAERAVSVGEPEPGAAPSRHVLGRRHHKEPGVEPVAIDERFLSDPLVHPSGRSAAREEVRSLYAEAERAGIQGRFDEAAELYWAAGRKAERLAAVQVMSIAAARAARMLKAAGKTELAADRLKVGWAGMRLCANQTWLYDELVFLVEIALELGRDQSVFTRHDYMDYVAPLHALSEAMRGRSADPVAAELAKRADDLCLRVSYDLVATKAPAKPYGS